MFHLLFLLSNLFVSHKQSFLHQPPFFHSLEANKKKISVLCPEHCLVIEIYCLLQTADAHDYLHKC